MSRIGPGTRRQGESGHPARENEESIMRFMCLVRTDETATIGQTPDGVWKRMAEYEQEGRRNGTLVDIGGLLPSASGAIVSLADGRISTVDGPFADTRELIGGYAIIEVHSREEAVELGRRVLQIHVEEWPGWEGDVEVRQLAASQSEIIGY
ncbi:YciI family protein [Leifsonia sp. YIM 134122]|uniref:YciI family protein n=1 Tax=Leifsonia stereocauli TaxID=3134136 RepID=A0ABU9W408_9MICO